MSLMIRTDSAIRARSCRPDNSCSTSYWFVLERRLSMSSMKMEHTGDVFWIRDKQQIYELRYLLAHGMLSEPAALQNMTPALDLVHSRPGDTALSESAGDVRRVMPVLCEKIPTKRAVELFTEDQYIYDEGVNESTSAGVTEAFHELKCACLAIKKADAKVHLQLEAAEKKA